MTDVALSLASRGSLLAIQAGQEMQARTTTRLATGLKVNTALDNPTSFFTSRSLNARAGDLSNLLDGISNARQTIEAADNGLKAMKRTIGQARAVLDEAIKAGAGDGLSTSASIDSYVNVADIRGRNIRGTGSTSQRLTLSVGKEASTTFVYGTDGTTVGDVYNKFKAEFDAGQSPIEPYWIDNTSDDGPLPDNGVQNYNSIGFRAQGEVVMFATTDEFSANNVVTRMGLYRGPNYSGDAGTGSALTGWKEGLSRDDSLSSPELAPFFTDRRYYSDLIDRGGGLNYVKFRRQATTDLNPLPINNGQVGGPTLGDMIDGFNAANDAGLFEFRAGLTDKGQFQLVATSDDARLRLPAGGIQHHGIGLGYGAGDLVPAATRTAEVVPAYDEFRGVIEQLADIAGDASYNGRNLLEHDILDVSLNESGSSLSLKGTDLGLGSLNLDDIIEADFVSLRTMELVGRRLDAAEAKIEAVSQQYGAALATLEIRENFTKSLSNVLLAGAANLVQADTNEEGANLLAINTRLQLSSNSLSLATQADQAVLRLF